jgi:hypothetical protein
MKLNEVKRFGMRVRMAFRNSTAIFAHQLNSRDFSTNKQTNKRDRERENKKKPARRTAVTPP